MRHTKRITLAAMLATTLIVLAAAPTSASRRFQLNPEGRIATISEAATFEFFGISIVCRIEFTATLAGEIPKFIGEHAGDFTGGRIAACRPAGTTAIMLGFPWRISYVNFAGRLPEGIIGIGLRAQGSILLSVRSIINSDCLYRGQILFVAANIGGVVTGLSIEERESELLLWSTLRGFCPMTGTIRGAFLNEPDPRLRLV